jgi:hypothetical protein
MSVHQLITNEVIFGFNLSQEVNGYLQKAAASVSSTKETLKALTRAIKAAPNQLESMMAMYKFLFYRGDLEHAEEVVFQTLVKASLQGRFSNNWKELTPESTDWTVIDGPARVYLYSLKALAFIRLRQNMPRDAKKILNVLERLDPEDQVGADVIRDLLDGVNGN